MSYRAEAATHPPSERETAAPGDKGTAVNQVTKAGTLSRKPYRKAATSAMRFADPDHRAAAKMLGFALVCHESAVWEAAAAIWRARLSRSERAALAVAALDAVDDDDLADTFEVALGGAA